MTQRKHMDSSVVCQGCGREFGIIQQSHIDNCHGLFQLGIKTRAEYKACFGSTMSQDAVAISRKTIEKFNSSQDEGERRFQGQIGYYAAIKYCGPHEFGRRGGVVGSVGLWNKPGQKERHRRRMRKQNANGSMTQQPNKLEEKFWELVGKDRLEFASFSFWKTIVADEGVAHITPDFRIPGTVRLIEVFGDYWHQGEDPADRIRLWESVGCECLVVWEHEINAEDSAMLERVDAFISGKTHECPAPTTNQVG